MFAASAASAASTASPHPSIKDSTKGGRPPPFVEAARSAASFMDRCGEAVEAAEAAEAAKT